MKTVIKISTTALAITLVFFACKKKDETPPPAASTTTGTTTGASPSGSTFTAVINSQNWAMGSDQFGPFIYLYNNFPQRGFGGRDLSSSPNSGITVYFMPAVGTFTLSQAGNYYATFTNTSSTTFTSKTGTLNITSFDTSGVKSPYLDKLKCTLSFMTDTIAGKSYTITNAYVDFIKN
ncbi:MAG: hypothetical protein KBG47_10805 [Bacteroidia bacterium]|nr:hypothetical protein [Bacteroidia bacterium]